MNVLLPVPVQGSTFAPAYDTMFYSLLALTSSVAVIVFILIAYFSIKYRAGATAGRDGLPDNPQTAGNRTVEAIWMTVPLLIFIGIFIWAADLYFTAQTPPAGAMHIFIVAKQWVWEAEHAGGHREINELHVPRGHPVQLTMISQDVIHSFFVPEFRLKQDVLPGRYAVLWFEAARTGEFHLFCAEYCGTDHSRMGGRIIVMEPADFQSWLAGSAKPAMSERGSTLYRSLGCGGCHDAGASVRAPSLNGIYGEPVPLQDGTLVTADERYMRDSILLPHKEIAAGYPDLMPSYAGQLNETQLLELTAYIVSLTSKERVDQ